MSQPQLLLTAEPEAREWSDLIMSLEERFDEGWLQDNLQNFMRETYKLIRSRGGYEHKVTHWTEDCAGDSDELSQNLLDRIDDILPVMLGHGHFSTVFECPWDEDKAIKIGYGPGGNTDIWEDGWLSYAAYCMKKQQNGYHNPILPNIYRLYISERQEFFVALLEKYDECWSDADGYVSPETRNKYKAIRGVLGGSIAKDVSPEYRKYAEELTKDPEFSRANDLHGGNIMVKDDRVVLTDPHGLGTIDQGVLASRLRHLGVLPEDKEEDERLRQYQKKKHLAIAERKMNMYHWSTTTMVVDSNGIVKIQSPFALLSGETIAFNIAC
jgi:hypothetical protein